MKSVKIDTLIIKFIWKHKGHRTTKQIFKNEYEGFILQDFRICYKAIIIMTVWYYCKRSHTYQINITVSLEIGLHIHGHLIFQQGTTNI